MDLQGACRVSSWPRARTGLAAVTCALAFWLTAGTAHGFLIDVRDVHVTQGTQTVDWPANNLFGIPQQNGNTLPLVANRPTAVRALIDVFLDPGEAPPTDILGRITVLVDNKVVINNSPNFAINDPFTPPFVPLIQNENDTLNFEIPARFFEIADRSKDSVEVDIAVRIGQGDNLLDSKSAADLTMLNLARPRILAEPVTYTPFSNTGPNQDFIRQGVGDAFQSAALPMESRCFTPRPGVRRCPYLPQETGFSSSVDDNNNGTLDYDIDPDMNQLDTSETTGVLDELIARRNLYVEDGDSSSEATFLYGWLPNGALSGHSGVADPAGKVGYGMDRLSQGQGTFPHELTHMHGLVSGTATLHNAPARAMIPNVGWDVFGKLVNNPAGNNITGRIKGFTLRDVMNNEGNLTNNRWLDSTTYQGMIDSQPKRSELASSSSGASASAKGRGAKRKRQTCRRAVTITGAVTKFTQNATVTKATDLVARKGRLDPAFFFPRCGPDNGKSSNSKAQVFVEVSYRVGKRVRRKKVPIDARVIFNLHNSPGAANQTNGHGFGLGPFSVTVPVPVSATVTSVRLVDRRGKALDVLRRSRRQPTLRVRTFRRNLQLRRRTKLRWRVSDRDTRTLRLRYHVAYSPDGRDFFPVDVNLKSKNVVVDAAKLPRSRTGKGVLRVFVSDGLNSRVTDLRGVTNRVSKIR